ncbi:CAMK/CAMKL protein kinase [Salpingoeca rosetta]|uniref:CAMK/CAMKL protein kinase n=1 Tax=Salpingoeca rosetta (strain ATCC 50818 / BSB-021) TaxID=946362 RepID=F2UDM8_SALR5|nr:CAMK/CAMKL protein kinase [Salpingoeca rosetta]EGD74723.1 CAMK/CAMKL protein kinase [Salpingoeca rosetta]|eukprot:XP_004992980.1 CAMK/CAMKL protein kinase [Salpingoeca rosetta]
MSLSPCRNTNPSTGSTTKSSSLFSHASNTGTVTHDNSKNDDTTNSNKTGSNREEPTKSIATTTATETGNNNNKNNNTDNNDDNTPDNTSDDSDDNSTSGHKETANTLATPPEDDDTDMSANPPTSPRPPSADQGQPQEQEQEEQHLAGGSTSSKRKQRKRHVRIAHAHDSPASAGAPDAMRISRRSLRRSVKSIKQVGPYAVGDKIGEGSYGAVHVATHLPTGQEVALKFIDRRKIKEKYIHENLEREVSIMQQLEHPFVIKLLQVVEFDDYMCIVTEKAEEDFLTILVDSGVIAEARAKKYAAQLMLAVQHLHQKGIAHRDLKVENMMLDKADHVKLIDFGLSNQLTPAKQLFTTCCGSLAYSAPELLGQKPYSFSVDVWGIGICLYVMLTARLPFHAESLTQLHANILEKNYTLPSSFSDDLKDLITRCFEFRPNKRITLDEMLAHPWAAEAVAEARTRADRLIEIDDEIVKRMTNMGYEEPEGLKESILANKWSSTYVTYHLFKQAKQFHKKKKPHLRATMSLQEIPSLPKPGGPHARHSTMSPKRHTAANANASANANANANGSGGSKQHTRYRSTRRAQTHARGSGEADTTPQSLSPARHHHQQHHQHHHHQQQQQQHLLQPLHPHPPTAPTDNGEQHEHQQQQHHHRFRHTSQEGEQGWRDGRRSDGRSGRSLSTSTSPRRWPSVHSRSRGRMASEGRVSQQQQQQRPSQQSQQSQLSRQSQQSQLSRQWRDGEGDGGSRSDVFSTDAGERVKARPQHGRRRRMDGDSSSSAQGSNAFDFNSGQWEDSVSGGVHNITIDDDDDDDERRSQMTGNSSRRDSYQDLLHVLHHDMSSMDEHKKRRSSLNVPSVSSLSSTASIANDGRPISRDRKRSNSMILLNKTPSSHDTIPAPPSPDLSPGRSFERARPTAAVGSRQGRHGSQRRRSPHQPGTGGTGGGQQMGRGRDELSSPSGRRAPSPPARPSPFHRSVSMLGPSTALSQAASSTRARNRDTGMRRNKSSTNVQDEYTASLRGLLSLLNKAAAAGSEEKKQACIERVNQGMYKCLRAAPDASFAKDALDIGWTLTGLKPTTDLDPLIDLVEDTIRGPRRGDGDGAGMSPISPNPPRRPKPTRATSTSTGFGSSQLHPHQLHPHHHLHHNHHHHHHHHHQNTPHMSRSKSGTDVMQTSLRAPFRPLLSPTPERTLPDINSKSPSPLPPGRGNAGGAGNTRATNANSPVSFLDDLQSSGDPSPRRTLPNAPKPNVHLSTQHQRHMRPSSTSHLRPLSPGRQGTPTPPPPTTLHPISQPTSRAVSPGRALRSGRSPGQ